MRLVLIAAVLVVVGALSAARTGEASGVVGRNDPCIQPLAGSATNHASLVVTFGAGDTQTFCIEFSEDSITGMDLLRRAGLDLVTDASGGLGAAVCSIEGVGCDDPGDCFCHCGGGSCEYWVYFRADGDDWQYSPIGAGTRKLHDGDADAWVFGSGDDGPETSGAVCPDPTETPIPSPVPTSTPRPAATPQAAATVQAAATPVVPPPVAPPAPPATALPVAPTTIVPATGSASVPPPAQAAGRPTAGPTSAVLSGARGDSVATPAGTATVLATLSAIDSLRTPLGVVQISDAQGKSNLAVENGGSWEWRSTAIFGVIAILVAGAGGVLIWRRRAVG